MARCGCGSSSQGSGGCGCDITAGEGITVTQVGDQYVISANSESPGDDTDEILTCDDARACLTAGPGIVYDPDTGVISLESETAAYAPQLFTGTDAVQLGSGSASGRYTKVGNLVQFSAQINVGTDATFTNDDPLAITIPYTAVDSSPGGPEQLVHVQAFNQNTGASINFLHGVGLIPEFGGSSVYRLQLDDSAAGGDLDNATRTTPYDWRGWSFRVSGSYEAGAVP